MMGGGSTSTFLSDGWNEHLDGAEGSVALSELVELVEERLGRLFPVPAEDGFQQGRGLHHVALVAQQAQEGPHLERLLQLGRRHRRPLLPDERIAAAAAAGVVIGQLLVLVVVIVVCGL